MGDVGVVEVDSLVVAWVWRAVRSWLVILSRSVRVVILVVSPSVLVWMVIVVVSCTVSWTVRVTVWRRVSVAAIVLLCCVTVLLLLQLTVNRASITMRAVVNLLYCIS